MNIVELYVKMFGISDSDLSEAPWLIEWVKRHHNNLEYNHYTFKYHWKS